jgi:copper(I)-binding protein
MMKMRVRAFGATAITVTAPLTRSHPPGAQVSGTGITLTAALARAHATGAQIVDNIPSPGAPDQYHRKL